MSSKILGCSVTDKSISRTKYINHVFRHVTGSMKRKGVIKPFETNTEVFILPGGGGMVLPYFKDSKGRWKIVLVGQYRPAVEKQTIEAAGGRLDGELPKIALSRELAEESDIKVKARSIKIVVREYVHPSIISASFFGGIVRINQCMVKNKKNAGKKSENEWTQVEVFDLVEILKKRGRGSITLDLMTSRLIDEVAKAAGLLVKKY